MRFLFLIVTALAASMSFAGEGKTLVKGDPEDIPVGHVKLFRPGAVSRAKLLVSSVIANHTRAKYSYCVL